MKHPLKLPANLIALGAILLVLLDQIADYKFAGSETERQWALYTGFGAIILLLAGEW